MMNKVQMGLVSIFSMAALMTYSHSVQAQETAPETVPASAAAVSSASASVCAFVEEELKMLKADRDNILAQVKIAYQQKNEALEAEKKAALQIEQLTAEKNELSEALNAEKSKAYTHVDQFYIERNTLSEQLKKVRKESYDKIEALEAEKNALVRELELAKKGLSSMPAAVIPSMTAVDTAAAAAALELKIMQTRNEELRRQIDELKADKNRTELQTAEQNSKIQTLIDELEAEKAKNRGIPVVPPEVVKASQNLNAVPGELISIKRERDRLLKENADLHYNLGVSLVQMGEYQRAVKEFLRTLELVPNDPESHFNLGRLYAQHLKDNDQAVRYFEKYVQLQPGAKDMDTVRKFIETVKAYNGEESFF